jgi:transcription termination/antitermination protein NusG
MAFINSDGTRRWYAVQTASGHENKVKEHIEKRVVTMSAQDRIFGVIVPEKMVTKVKEGKRIEKKEREYPGYVFVEMILDDDSWRVVREAPGVTKYVGAGKKPIAVQEDEIRKILRRQIASAGVKGKKPAAIDIKMGDYVRITGGPFADFTGEITEVNLERERLKASVIIFGRATPVELEFNQVIKV